MAATAQTNRNAADGRPGRSRARRCAMSAERLANRWTMRIAEAVAECDSQRRTYHQVRRPASERACSLGHQRDPFAGLRRVREHVVVTSQPRRTPSIRPSVATAMTTSCWARRWLAAVLRSGIRAVEVAGPRCAAAAARSSAPSAASGHPSRPAPTSARVAGSGTGPRAHQAALDRVQPPTLEAGQRASALASAIPSWHGIMAQRAGTERPPSSDRGARARQSLGLA
jgi:hypothetical protein